MNSDNVLTFKSSTYYTEREPNCFSSGGGGGSLPAFLRKPLEGVRLGMSNRFYIHYSLISPRVFIKYAY